MVHFNVKLISLFCAFFFWIFGLFLRYYWGRFSPKLRVLVPFVIYPSFFNWWIMFIRFSDPWFLFFFQLIRPLFIKSFASQESIVVSPIFCSSDFAFLCYCPCTKKDDNTYFHSFLFSKDIYIWSFFFSFLANNNVVLLISISQLSNPLNFFFLSCYCFCMKKMNLSGFIWNKRWTFFSK